MNIPILIFFGILGLFFGSFFNCVINADKRGSAPTHCRGSRRHADKLKIWGRRSACPKCGHKLGFWDLIPVLSFIFLRRKCRYCKQVISWQYPVIEVVTAILFVFVAGFYLLNFGFRISDFGFFIKDLFFVSVLLLLFVFDLKYRIIPDRISIPAIVVAIGFNIFFIFVISSSVIPAEAGIQISKILLAMAIGGGFFLIQFLISKGRWIGGGDIRLGILMGAMLSWPNILLALFLAYIFGAVYGLIAIILKKKTLKSAIPFGTFLTVATFVTLFWGIRIINWYLGLL